MNRAVLFLAVLVPLLALAGPSAPPESRSSAPRITLKSSGSLREVAERIASEGKLSVVVRGDLDEDAEVYFQNVPADEALETLARAYGLSLEKHGNIYTLRPHADGSPAPKLVAPLPPIPSTPPMAPMPPMPAMPHMWHDHDRPPSDDEDEVEQDEDSDGNDEDADSQDLEDKLKDLRNLKDLKDLGKLKEMLKLHRQGGSDRQSVGTGSVTVEEDQEVDDAVAYGGSVEVKGRVRGDAVAFGGGVHLGPHAVVDGDAVAFGGKVEREPGAKVRGQVVSFGGGSSALTALGPSDAKSHAVEKHSDSSLFGLLVQFAVYFALGFVFMMFAPKPMKQLEAEIRRDPIRCGLTGVLGGAAILGFSVLLIFTLIGIPFAVVLLFVTAVGGAMGLSALASEVGTRLPVLRANGKTQAAVLALGILVLLILQLIPVLRYLVFLVTGSLALGAVIRTRFGTRPREFPEPI